MHTLVYIVATIPVHVPLGIFRTMLFPGSWSLSPRGARVAGIHFLASCGDLLLICAFPPSTPSLLHQHLICVDILSLLCFSCVRGSWLPLVSFPLRPPAAFLSSPAAQGCCVCSPLLPAQERCCFLREHGGCPRTAQTLCSAALLQHLTDVLLHFLENPYISLSSSAVQQSFSDRKPTAFSVLHTHWTNNNCFIVLLPLLLMVKCSVSVYSYLATGHPFNF